MKILLGLFFALMLAAFDAESAETKAVWSWETQIRSEYLGKIGIVFYDKPIMVNDITLSYGDFYAGTWISTGLGGDTYGSTFADEFDLYAGWGHTYGWIRFDLTGAFFFIKDLDRVKNDIWIAEGEVSFPKVPIVQPYLAVRSFNQVSSESPERGAFAWFGLRRLQPLGLHLHEKELKLKLDLLTAYSDGALHRNPGWVFGRVTVGLPLPISKHLTLTPSVLYQIPIGDQVHQQRPYTVHNEIVGALSARWVF
jgi:hypothetical protein